MSQKPTRKGVVDEKEKRQTDSPVKDMKKKMAANAEKEKQASAAEKTEAQPEKSTEKQDKNAKQPEKKVDKTPEKSKEDKKVDKNEKVEKNEKAEKEKKNEKAEKEKKSEKPAEKTTEQSEKPKEDKGEKSAKRQKQNGHNGVDATTTNGSHNGTDDLNGDVEMNGQGGSPSDEDEDDELFPELAYDDSEDGFEPATDGAHSRSYTRRSQAKLTRTPETPRPASAKHDASEDSKDSKVLKMKDDLSTDRKLRSADSPKPESKKEKKEEEGKEKEEKENKEEKAEEGEKEKMEVEVVVEVEEEGARKTDTNFSKSRVKVSPYRRSMRLADQTTSSMMANYTGNNTTMEMDITETSSFISEEPSLDDSYLSGLRSIRGRRSYKPLKEMSLRSVTHNKSLRSNTSLTASEQPSRPTGTVVGRKRKPDADDTIEIASEAGDLEIVHGKRMRLLDRIAQPFRRTTVTNSGVARRAADIVGINTDLPLTAPVASPETFDPESLKPPPAAPLPAAPAAHDKDGKRCVVM